MGRSRFYKWLDIFTATCTAPSVFDHNELRTAWFAGKDARKLAEENDRLFADYPEEYAWLTAA